MSKKPKILFYGVLVSYRECQTVAVTTQKSARYGGARWYGRLLRPGVAFEDAASTKGTTRFVATFDTREQAEAAYELILASQNTFLKEWSEAQKAHDAGVKAARLRHEERVAAIPGVRKPAS